MSKVFGSKKPVTKKSVKTTDEESLASIHSKLEAMGISKPSKPKYHIELPNGQTIVQTVPKSGSHCFWCKCPPQPNTCPLALPVGFDKSQQKFICEGSFCSANCAIAYGQNQQSVKYRDSLGLLYTLLKKLKGKVPFLQASKDWKLLQDFGGPMQPNEYHNDHFVLTAEDVGNYNESVIMSSQTFILI